MSIMQAPLACCTFSQRLCYIRQPTIVCHRKDTWWKLMVLTSSRTDRRSSLHRRHPVRELAAHPLWQLAQDILHIMGSEAEQHGPVVYALTGTPLVFCAIRFHHCHRLCQVCSSPCARMLCHASSWSSLMRLISAVRSDRTALINDSYVSCATCSIRSSHFSTDRRQSPCSGCCWIHGESSRMCFRP